MNKPNGGGFQHISRSQGKPRYGVLSKRRKAAIREAVKLRTAAEVAESEVKAAADQDREAFRQGAE